MILERDARDLDHFDRGSRASFKKGRERRQCRRGSRGGVKNRHANRAWIGAHGDLRLRLMARAAGVVHVRRPGQLHKHQQRGGKDRRRGPARSLHDAGQMGRERNHCQ